MNNITWTILWFWNILLLFVKILFAKEIVIRNDDDYWKNFANTLNNNQNDNELILRFIDDYYIIDYVSNSALNLLITKKVIFRGNENGTVFDYIDKRIGFNIKFSTNKDEKLSFENIIFKNYQEKVILNGVPLLDIQSSISDFYITFDNCIFQDNKYKIFQLKVDSFKSLKSEYHLIFNNCKF
ncbi:hypothetical protein BCR36DRAFT_366402 [Piromyces finnis]|uniref:Uncharacterized protein n=1 Tax=Piromyces finnis TaxID=1754191 RepID=A0A1Y1VM56_9FUNG|nr:hypothetical protein BCR36DRAFT_366402 [Piromyces finnis]|eukprot:ORX59216.1 hypothetical protein BCR36DRAFT_366402 [Piromyces finnis]